MPIYAYRCATCGHAQDVLQKMSDPLLTVCPNCGAPTYVKQVTAAGFQLKGSGWYVTDFRGDGGSGKKAADESSTAVPAVKAAAGSDSPTSDSSSKKSDAASPAAPSAAPAPSSSSAAPAASSAPAPAPPPSSGKPTS